MSIPPKRRKQESRPSETTRVAYCPRCRASTTQRTVTVSAAGKGTWLTGVCERCGFETESSKLPTSKRPQERGRLTFTPETVIHRIPIGKAERARFLKQLRDQAPASLKETWADSKRRGTDKLTMAQINAEVSAVRRRAQKTNKTKAPGR